MLVPIWEYQQRSLGYDGLTVDGVFTIALQSTLFWPSFPSQTAPPPSPRVNSIRELKICIQVVIYSFFESFVDLDLQQSKLAHG